MSISKTQQALRGQGSRQGSRRRRRARATGCEQERRLCRTSAEARELPGAEPEGRAWSMAAAGTCESWAARAGWWGVSGGEAEMAVTRRDPT